MVCYEYTFVSATEKYALYIHQHKTALPQIVTYTLLTEITFISGTKLKAYNGTSKAGNIAGELYKQQVVLPCFLIYSLGCELKIGLSRKYVLRVFSTFPRDRTPSEAY